MNQTVTITHLGCPGHFILASHCRWRRHTQIGTSYRVSTVGDYYPEEGKRKWIGSERHYFFETMVFTTSAEPDPDSEGCGCLTVTSSSCLESDRYTTAGEAQRGHDAMVETYAMKDRENKS